MSARSLNKVFLIGNLTRDVELRYTPQGTAVATFGMATNRTWTSGEGGEKQEDTQFHRIVAWSKLAEICDQLLFKGRKVLIEGRLQTRKWTSQDGQQRESTEIVAENMMILDTRTREGGQSNQRQQDSDWVDVADEATNEEPLNDEIKIDEEEPKKAKESSKDEKKVKSSDNESVEVDDIPF